MAKINVQQTAITLLKVNEQDYISLTDIARHKSDDPTAVIGNWMPRPGGCVIRRSMSIRICNPQYLNPYCLSD